MKISCFYLSEESTALFPSMKGARPYPQVDRKQNNRLMNVFEYSFNPLVHMAPASDHQRTRQIVLL